MFVSPMQMQSSGVFYVITANLIVTTTATSKKLFLRFYFYLYLIPLRDVAIESNSVAA